MGCTFCHHWNRLIQALFGLGVCLEPPEHNCLHVASPYEDAA